MLLLSLSAYGSLALASNLMPTQPLSQSPSTGLGYKIGLEAYVLRCRQGDGMLSTVTDKTDLTWGKLL